MVFLKTDCGRLAENGRKRRCHRRGPQIDWKHRHLSEHWESLYGQANQAILTTRRRDWIRYRHSDAAHHGLPSSFLAEVCSARLTGTRSGYGAPGSDPGP